MMGAVNCHREMVHSHSYEYCLAVESKPGGSTCDRSPANVHGSSLNSGSSSSNNSSTPRSLCSSNDTKSSGSKSLSRLLNLTPGALRKVNPPSPAAFFTSIQACWHGIGHKQQMFLQIMYNVLSSDHALQQLFKINLNEEGGYAAMEAHADKLYLFFENIMQKGTMEEVFEECRKLGGRHTDYGVHFSAQYWLVFKRVLMDSLCTDLLSTILWNQFITELFKNIRAGFSEKVLSKWSSKKVHHEYIQN